jgi:asparagine synthase (glutamine-hydrolysing)
MCGVAGFLARHAAPDEAMADTARRMASTLAHRGPDDAGVWTDAAHGIALGHRRLAIVDISAHGHQPMASACGRYVISFNGEIYNHAELRANLPAHPWRGHSDTETLLACLSARGIEGTLARLVGMFAFAAWDRQARRLILARDRLGEKPLYWGFLRNGDFVFGSELDALRVHPEWSGEIDPDAVALFMRDGAVPAPHSIHLGIRQLQPGEWLEVQRDGRIALHRYWDIAAVARAARATPHATSDDEAIEALDKLLGTVIRGQMTADVPVGAFLSGGIDSSLVVALLRRHSAHPVSTFSVAFDEAEFDESSHARAVATHLGTRHTEIRVTAADALRLLPQLPGIYDEPFADPSQIPTVLVSRLARADVTVALSGDGGDELFGGYNRYLIADRVWPRLRRVPWLLRHAAARAIVGVPPAAWGALARAWPATRGYGDVGAKVHKFARAVLPATSPGTMYRTLMSTLTDSSKLLASDAPLASGPVFDEGALAGFSDAEAMSLFDQMSYLPDYILVKVDRAAMSTSLETRAPLLDHRLVDFAWRTPMHQKIRNGKGKWLLRQVLERYVPRALIDRPKQGFGVPLAPWLRGPLREWASDMLAPSALRRHGLFDVDEIQRSWRAHAQGLRNEEGALWNVLMFQAWWMAHCEPSGVAPARPGPGRTGLAPICGEA